MSSSIKSHNSDRSKQPRQYMQGRSTFSRQGPAARARIAAANRYRDDDNSTIGGSTIGNSTIGNSTLTTRTFGRNYRDPNADDGSLVTLETYNSRVSVNTYNTQGTFNTQGTLPMIRRERTKRYSQFTLIICGIIVGYNIKSIFNYSSLVIPKSYYEDGTLYDSLQAPVLNNVEEGDVTSNSGSKMLKLPPIDNQNRREKPIHLQYKKGGTVPVTSSGTMSKQGNRIASNGVTSSDAKATDSLWKMAQDNHHATNTLDSQSNSKPNYAAQEEAVEKIMKEPEQDEEENTDTIVNAPTIEAAMGCISSQGQNGTWEVDMEYASNAQYVTPITKFHPLTSFTPTSDHPYRNATTYKWVDSHCPVETLTLEGLCSAMKSLDLHRIFIVGDSLSHYMAFSLWKLLKFDDDPNSCMGGTDQKAKRGTLKCHSWERIVTCPAVSSDLSLSKAASSTFEFTIVFRGNDIIGNPKIGEQSEEFECKADYLKAGMSKRRRVCIPWVHKYWAYDKPTLLIVNSGPHVHSEEEFIPLFDEFINITDGHRKDGDVIMWRTTVPGHDKCETPNLRPFASLADYDHDLNANAGPDSKVYKYAWDKFNKFNNYAKKVISQRKAKQKIPSLDKAIHLLDVYPMTVLRRDGHVGSEKCASCNPRGPDCLHYLMPGPIDWWLHLMYSKLLIISYVTHEIANQQQAVSATAR